MRLGRPDTFQEGVDLAAQHVGLLGQFLGGDEDLGGRGAGFSGSLVDLGDVCRNVPCADGGFLDIGGNFMGRRRLFLDGVGDCVRDLVDFRDRPGDLLDHMRDFAAHPTGIYELTFPEDPHPTNFSMEVENMLTTDDLVVIGIEFDGSLDPVVQMLSYGTPEEYTALTSLQEVRDSQGATYWQDNANNLVWVKLRGGHWEFWTDEVDPTPDELLYESTVLRIYVP